MANGNYRQVTYIQFDTSTQSQLTPPYFFALRLVLLTLIVVTVTIITMSALIARDSANEQAQSLRPHNRVFPRDLTYTIEYDKLPILSINSVLHVQVTFLYKSIQPFDANISLSDIDKNLPQATWKVKDIMKDKLIGFFSTDESIHIANGTEWTAKYAWLRSSPKQETAASNVTTSP